MSRLRRHRALRGTLGGRISARGNGSSLHVKSRHEKALAKELEFIGICYYLPLVDQDKYYGRHKAFVQMPLFPGYLFLRGTMKMPTARMAASAIARILRVSDQQQLDGELENLHLA